MAAKKGFISRRNFLKTAGAIGVGSMLPQLNDLTAAQNQSDSNTSRAKVVPTRPFGRPGVDVPILGLGEAFGCSGNLLLKKGLTPEQVKLKAVWDGRRIASIASIMKNMTILMANVAAAVDGKKLSQRDRQLLDQYGRQTASHYCTGCASICEPEINNEVPISDVMRYLMYASCYGDLASAKTQFNNLASKVRAHMAYIDYKKAEQKCPQRM